MEDGCGLGGEDVVERPPERLQLNPRDLGEKVLAAELDAEEVDSADAFAVLGQLGDARLDEGAVGGLGGGPVGGRSARGSSRW